MIFQTRSRRDWGLAQDYVRAMWMLLQQEVPQDYVIASNETRMVREFAEEAFLNAGFEIVWEGEGVHEIGKDKESGRTLVKANPDYFRPAEVELLWGNTAKAEAELGWRRGISFQELVGRMVRNDMEIVAKEITVADFCRQAALIEAGKKDPVIGVGNLKVKRDFTDVRDVVRAYAMVAAHGAAGETYNVGSGRAVSLEEILRIILRMSETEISVVVDPKKLRPADLPVMEADPDRLQKAAGWKPLIGLEQTIKETLDY